MQRIKLSFLENEEQYVFDYVAKQASGSVYYQSGNNVLLAAVTIDSDCVVEKDFLPLTVQYMEKSLCGREISGWICQKGGKA